MGGSERVLYCHCGVPVVVEVKKVDEEVRRQKVDPVLVSPVVTVQCPKCGFVFRHDLRAVV